MTENGSEAFAKRIDELCRESIRHVCPRFIGFLTPEEQQEACRRASAFTELYVLAFGVFEEAERNVLGFFPSDVYPSPEDGGDEAEYETWAELAVLEVRGSGYRVFSHRDILGSVMALGIKRETVGDILLTKDGYTAYMAVSESVADYLCAVLENAANDRVKVRRVAKNALPKVEKRFEDMVLTLPSLRLDALVSELARLSRDKAKKLFAAGKVSLNHTVVYAPDKSFAEKDVVTVAGYGKFLVDGLLGQTAKDRDRVVVRKYL